MQRLVLLLFRLSSAILHLFLRIFIGFRLKYELNLKYLPLPTRLSMVWLLLILSVFFEDTTRQEMLGPQRLVPALNINSYGRRAFSVVLPLLWNSLPQNVIGMLNLWPRLKDG